MVWFSYVQLIEIRLISVILWKSKKAANKFEKQESGSLQPIHNRFHPLHIHNGPKCFLYLPTLYVSFGILCMC